MVWMGLIALFLQAVGLLCLAMTQPAHAHHGRWARRLDRVWLNSRPRRLWAACLACVGSAALLVVQDGWAFGLVTWVMALALGALCVALWLMPVQHGER